jgi:hypothetical protein
MTQSSFTTAAGHRAAVPKIAIVVTDGRSNNPNQTAAAAAAARAAGERYRIYQSLKLKFMLLVTGFHDVIFLCWFYENGNSNKPIYKKRDVIPVLQVSE